MDSLMQSNIFFVVTTVAIIIVTIFLVILLVYALGIFRNVKKISDQAKKETDEIVKDVSLFRGLVEKFFKKQKKK